MRLYNILDNEKQSIFKRYNELYPDDLQTIYDDIDDNFITYLDVLFTSMYGNKTLSNTVLYYHTQNYDSCIDFICWLLHFSCFKRVLDVKDLYNKVYEIGSRSETYSEKTNIDTTSQNNSSMENIQNTYGYDSDTAVKDNSTTNTDTDEHQQASTTEKEYKRIYTDKPMSELIDNEINRKIDSDFILLTFKCYANILFIDIYE